MSSMAYPLIVEVITQKIIPGHPSSFLTLISQNYINKCIRIKDAACASRTTLNLHISSGIKKPEGFLSLPPHDKYRNFCFFVDYAIGNAAEDRNCQSALPVRAHNNQICLCPRSFLHNSLNGMPCRYHSL